MEQLELRPEVAAFAQAMERRLRANDHKPGWKNDTAGALMNRVYGESDELADCLNRIGRPPGLILDEAADVGNFVMMVADIVGELI